MTPDPSAGRRTRRAWHIATAAFMVVSAYVVVAGRDHAYMDTTGPGPGFFPEWVGGLGLVAGLGLLWWTYSRGPAAQEPWTLPARADAIRILLTILAVFVTGLVLEPLGFRLTMFLFIAALLRVYGVGWLTALAGAAVSAIAVHFVFSSLLKVMLPIGALGF